MDDSLQHRLQVQGDQIAQLNTTIQQLSLLLQNQDSRNTAIEGVLQNLSSTVQALRNPVPSLPEPSIPPIVPTIVSGTSLNDGIVKELSKKVNSFPEASRLKGPENFDQWKQALAIMFRALGLPTFISEPSIAKGLGDPEQAVILMLLRDSCGPGPQAAISWLSDPTMAFELLIRQYSTSPELQRDSLYRKFHSLTFGSFTGSIADFNTEFNGLVARLQLIGVIFNPIDLVNQYLQCMEKVFP